MRKTPANMRHECLGKIQIAYIATRVLLATIYLYCSEHALHVPQLHWRDAYKDHAHAGTQRIRNSPVSASTATSCIMYPCSASPSLSISVALMSSIIPWTSGLPVSLGRYSMVPKPTQYIILSVARSEAETNPVSQSRYQQSNGTCVLLCVPRKCDTKYEIATPTVAGANIYTD